MGKFDSTINETRSESFSKKIDVARVAGTSLVDLEPDLRAISTTTNRKDEVVELFMQSAMARSSLLGIAWIEFPEKSEPIVVCSLFRDVSLPQGVFQKEFRAIADRVKKRSSIQTSLATKIHGAQSVGVPVFVDAETSGVVCGLTAKRVYDGGDEPVLVLSMISAFYDIWRGRQECATAAREVQNVAALIELVEKVQCCVTLRTASQTIANELKDFLKCDYVAVGLRKNAHRKMSTVVAISSQSQFNKNSTMIGNFQNAMDEAIVRDDFTAFPPRNNSSRNTLLAHKKLCSHLNSLAAVSVPLRDEQDEAIGAVTIVGNYSMGADAESRNLIQCLASPLGSAMKLVKRIEGGPLRKIQQMFVSRRSNGPLFSIAAVSLLVVLAMFVPVTYRISGQFTAEPVLRKFCVAPHDGLLESTYVQSGDRVVRGQLLAKMDGHEIGLEIDGLAADREKAIRQRDRFKVLQNNSDELIAENERLKIESKYMILYNRQAHLELLSPIDGIVLAGSIDRRENYPVSIGQSLYEIAPIDELRIEISVAADQIMHVKNGQVIELRFSGFGTETLYAVVERVRPSSTIRNSQNVFIVETVVQNQQRILRPGMQGTASILSGRHRLGWNLFHLALEKFVTMIGF